VIEMIHLSDPADVPNAVTKYALNAYAAVEVSVVPTGPSRRWYRRLNIGFDITVTIAEDGCAAPRVP
jgi:hypothetical protein